MKITDYRKAEEFIKSDETFDEYTARVFASVQETVTASVGGDGYDKLTEMFYPFDKAIVASYVPEWGEESYVPFIIDVVLPEGTDTGDGRTFEIDSVSVRDLPIPLMWQVKTGTGHDGAYVVGRIDSVERLDKTVHGYDGLGRARGVFDCGPLGREAVRMIRGGFLRGVSADLDKFEATVEEAEMELADGETKRSIKNDKMEVSQSRLTGVTIVAKPAFQEATIRIDDHVKEIPELDAVDDGVYVEEYDDDEMYLSAVTASAIPVVPPNTWFTNPELSDLTPLTVNDDGRVFGHVAAWTVNHIGLPKATKPPRSASNYKYFRTGVVRTDDGTDVAVGQLTLTGGHPDLTLSAREAVAHYDDTRSAVVDVNIGEDRYGIWVAGALRPDLRPEQVRALRASAPSGDWRPIEGRLELVAVACVNTPGFPIARTLVAGGQVMALVAAGAKHIAELRVDPTEERLRALEVIEFGREKARAAARIKGLKAEYEAGLVASALEARTKLEALSASESVKLVTRVAELRNRVNR